MTNFLDPLSRTGIIVLGVMAALIAALIASFIGLTGKKMAPILRNWGIRHLPQWANRAVGRVVFWLRPSTRSVAGSRRTKRGLDGRLAMLSTQRRPKIVVIGGVYLDGTLAPINVDQLDGVTEYSDLEPLEWTCGGTAHYVARYLKEYRNTRSYLFTRIGDDSLSGELKRKLKVEGKIESTKGEQCGVSIHLRRRIDIAKVDTAKVDTEKVDTKKAETENGNSDWRWTTFTHKGALANLTWPSVMPQLQRKTESPSLLYISSYFRTSLWQNLTDSLQKISPRAVVCVSHGRYAKGENPAAVNELIRAFQEGQVDIYICTLRELKRLIEDSGRTIPYVTTRKFLKALAVEKLLPRITVVRPIGNDATTYYMIDRSVRKETARGREANRPGLNGAFSAGLIYGLCRAVEGQGIEGTAERAVRLAIDDYCNAASEAS